MRDYEVTVIYDLALAEGEGHDAPVQRLTAMVRNVGGEVTAVDHWGRRRLAYPIRHKIDGDYVIARVRLDAASVRPLEHALRIDEQVFRFLVVRAEELPPLATKAATSTREAPLSVEESRVAPEPAADVPSEAAPEEAAPELAEAAEEPAASIEGDDTGEQPAGDDESGPQGEDPNPETAR